MSSAENFTQITMRLKVDTYATLDVTKITGASLLLSVKLIRITVQILKFHENNLCFH